MSLRGCVAFTLFWLAVLLRAQGDIAPALTLDIPVFSGGYGIAFYEETAREFEKLRPGVKINLYGDPRIEDKIRVRIIDGDYPDAALTGQLLWPTLIRAGKVLDLTPFLAEKNWEGDAAWGTTFMPGSLDSWRMEKGVYGLPFSYACWTIFYDRALFRAHGWTEPRTWDEFLALCEKIRASNLAPISLPGTRWLYPNAFLRAAFYNLAGANRWRDLSELKPGIYLDERHVRCAALFQRLAQNYFLRGWQGETHTGAQQAFFQGRAAMTVSGTWLINEMKGKMPAGFELGVMNFPMFSEGAADPSTIQTGSDCFFVFATGNHEREQATVDFLRFLTSRARAEAFVRKIDAPVAVRGVPAEAYSPLMRDTALLIGRATEAFNMPQTMLQPPAVRQALIDNQKALLAGDITPQEFSARLEAAAERHRTLLANPDSVEVRHPVSGGLLLLLPVVIFGWMVWRRCGRRQCRQADANVSRKSEALQDIYFAPMRPRLAAGFVGPALLLYAVLVLAPALASFGWAFTRWDGIGPRSWAGLFNFKWLIFESDLFWLALKNNLYLMLVPTLLVVPAALLMATLIHRGVWGAKFFRVVFLFPNLLGGIAATLLWMNAYSAHGGLVNTALVKLGELLGNAWLQSFADYAWLSTANLYHALIPIYLWMACGFNLILYLAAMEGINPELYEAAEIEGASAWRQFFTITLPMIWDVLAISAVFIVIAGLNTFEMIWLMTWQDPDSSVHVLSTLMVTTMFKEFQVGRATAIAVVMFMIVLAGSAVVLRTMRSRDSAVG